MPSVQMKTQMKTERDRDRQIPREAVEDIEAVAQRGRQKVALLPMLAGAAVKQGMREVERQRETHTAEVERQREVYEGVAQLACVYAPHNQLVCVIRRYNKL